MPITYNYRNVHTGRILSSLVPLPEYDQATNWETTIVDTPAPVEPEPESEPAPEEPYVCSDAEQEPSMESQIAKRKPVK